MSRFHPFFLAPFAVVLVATTSFATALPASAAKAPRSKTVTVLVTNDDGVAAPGIDALVQALRTVKNTKVVVVAPATNQTARGGDTTPTPHTTSAATTASGYAATAVQGTPADTITTALDQLGVKPNVVMSGINNGQNLGPTVAVSGTVGAARAAAKRGIPAIALSQGPLGDTPQYGSAAKLAVSWLAAHRAQLVKKAKTAPTTITNLNVPNCPSGKPRGVKVVTTATDGTGALGATVDCAAPVTHPTTDIEAFNAGWAAEAHLALG
jgi:5'-nucleotidase